MNTAVMTPFHPDWHEFYNRLQGPEGCDFKKDSKGKITWTCAAGRDKSLAIKILESMSVDVPASLTYFENHGGYCDCEILFNVEATSVN